MRPRRAAVVALTGAVLGLSGCVESDPPTPGPPSARPSAVLVNPLPIPGAPWRNLAQVGPRSGGFTGQADGRKGTVEVELVCVGGSVTVELVDLATNTFRCDNAKLLPQGLSVELSTTRPVTFRVTPSDGETRWALLVNQSPMSVTDGP